MNTGDMCSIFQAMTYFVKYFIILEKQKRKHDFGFNDPLRALISFHHRLRLLLPIASPKIKPCYYYSKIATLGKLAHLFFKNLMNVLLKKQRQFSIVR